VTATEAAEMMLRAYLLIDKAEADGRMTPDEARASRVLIRVGEVSDGGD